MDPIETLNTVIDQTGGIIAGVKSGQMGDATPCTEWDVRGLLNHTIAGARMWTAAAKDEEISAEVFSQDFVGDDPSASWQREAAALREALKASGLIERTWKLPFGEMPGMIALGFASIETAAHGWDIAKATGQQPGYDEGLFEGLLAGAKMAPAEQLRQPGVFGPEVPCDPGAPAADRFAAFLGRAV
jgi:uncharacterized protein (TIGR03086 family)